MKLKKVIIPAILIFVLFALSVTYASALTLYSDDGYTFADTGVNSVALYDCDNISDTLVVPNNYQSKYVTSVYNYAFNGNNNIVTLDFSNNYILNSIGTKAFAECSNLSGSIVLPQTISSLGLGAFQECPNITSVTLNGSVTVIPEQCFYKDYMLREVNLPTNLERIERLAFAECYSLRNIFIPSSVSFIHSNAFMNSRNVVINCYTDSYAHKYAEENGVAFYLLDAESEPATVEPTTEEPAPPATPDEPTVEPTEEPTTEPAEPDTEEPTSEPSTEPVEQPSTNPATPDEPVIKLGDVNGDGIVDVLDALEIQKAAVDKVFLTEAQKTAGDINHDGFVDVIDALLIQKYTVGKYEIK